MRKMLTFKGVAKSGKSTKVKNVANWVIEKYSPLDNDIIDLNFSRVDILGIIKTADFVIGFISAGDTAGQVKQVDKLIDSYPEINVIINSCRTRGEGHNHIKLEYSDKDDWQVDFIEVQHFAEGEIEKQLNRDKEILEYVKMQLINIVKG
ncbi:hypothetical protein [Flavobacterium sp. NKUCC04_CG]|uniref:hypothetical protein n=1 Tax=Flavobacterium sp. NKUCC04_CG TaxID=2842121 RepID=UPI001C5B381C|nr:hypothetical protein [Flavobacterium sp. NKUCC04_CG]MBW3519868.1 hypothetical protein [Flavobacterium sp. NKUCC04_CG]